MFISGIVGYLEWNLRESGFVIQQRLNENEIKEGLHVHLVFPAKAFCQVIHFLMFRSGTNTPAGATPLLQPWHLPEEEPGR